MSGLLVRWSVQFRLLVLALAAGVVALGVIFIPRMAMDSLPEFRAAHVEIQTEALGLSAVEVEQLITSPLETDILNGVAFLDEIRSESVPGLSSIELIFEPGTDLLRARQLVAERLTRAKALPKVSTPPVLMQPTSSTSRVMIVKLSSTEVSLIDMSVLARWNIKPRLMGVPGVANVSIWGQREQQMQVHVDPEVLRAHGVTLNQVIETTGNAVWVSPLTFLEASTPGTGGFLETGNQRIGIQHVLPITTPGDLAMVSVEGVAGQSLALGDIATVLEDHQPLIGDAVGDQDPGLMLVIEKFPEANTLEVTAQLEQALGDLGPGLAGIEIDDSVYRPAGFIQSAANTLGIALLVSALLAAVLLGIFFRSWRVMLLGLVAVAVPTFAAALVLFAFGAVLNIMVFAGLALAMAVIVGDVVADLSALRRIGTRTTGTAPVPLAGNSPSTATTIADTLSRTRTPIGYATLIMALAVAPALFLPGVDGALLRPLALSYVFALVTAMIVAWTLTPALAVTLTLDAPGRTTPRWADRARHRYTRALSSASAHTKTVLGAAALVALAGTLALPGLATGQPTVPVLQDRTLLVQLGALPGMSMQEMNRVAARASREVGALNGVSKVGGHVGRALTSDTAGGVSAGELWVTVAADADHGAVAAAVREVIEGYPGLTSTLVNYGNDRVSAERSRPAEQVVVRVYGVDQGTLRNKAEEVRDLVGSTQGVLAPRLELSPEQPTVEIEVDLVAAQQAAIKPGDVRRAAAALLQGIEVGFLFEKQKVFQVLVMGVPATRNSLTSVDELLIDTPSGGHIRLGDIAAVNVVPHQTTIHHVDTSRFIDVVADLDGRSRADVEADVRAALPQIDFPLEYHAEIPTQLADQQSSTLLVWSLLAAAIILMLVLLQSAAGSWRVGALVLLGLPLALAGGVLGALYGGGINSLATLIGFVAVLGVAVRDSVLLVRRAQTIDGERSQEGSNGPGRSAVLDAARARLVPTVSSSLITAAVLIPLVLLGDVVGREIFLPLAMVVWGGLITSGLMTMFVLPALLLLVGAQLRDDQMTSAWALSRGVGETS